MTGHKASPAAARPPAPAAPAPLLVVGLGPAGPEHLAEAARRALRSSDRVVLRTRRHPSAEAFEALASFDHLYEESSRFDEVYRRIVEDLVASARAAREADEAPPVYAVPGSPMVAERTVELLRADPRVAVQVVPALSFLDLAWAVLGVDPLAAGVRLVDGVRFATEAAGARGPLLVAQCWSAAVLSEIKLSLDTDEPEPAGPVVLLHHLGLADQQVVTVGWWELDRVLEPDHLTSLWIPELHAPVAGELAALGELVRRLRRDCPWDREQTHASLARHLLEESYEVLDAIAALPPDDAAPPPGDDAVAHFCEELGDLLFQVFFHAGLAAEEGWFTLADVARGVHDKLVFRHPHVFGSVVADTPDAVAANWEVLKKAEKGRSQRHRGRPRPCPRWPSPATCSARPPRCSRSIPGWTRRPAPPSPSASGRPPPARTTGR